MWDPSMRCNGDRERQIVSMKDFWKRSRSGKPNFMSGRRNELGLLTAIVAVLSFSLLISSCNLITLTETPVFSRQTVRTSPTHIPLVGRPRPKIAWSCAPPRYRSDIHANQYGVQRILLGHIYIHREVLTLKSSANLQKNYSPPAILCFASII